MCEKSFSIKSSLKNYFVRSSRRGLISRLGTSILTWRTTRVFRWPIQGKPKTYFSNMTQSRLELKDVNRIIRFLAQNSSFLDGSIEDYAIWTPIIELQRDLFAIVDKGNHKELLEYLGECPKNSLGTGVLQGIVEFERLSFSRGYNKTVGRIIFYRLIRLFESVGLGFRVNNPEQGKWRRSICEIAEADFRKLEEVLGTRVESPKCLSGLLQISMHSRSIDLVTVMALNTFLRVRNLSKVIPFTNIVEIGAGSGFLALHLLKINQVNRLKIIDLPHAIALQAYLFMNELGPENVWLFGEPEVWRKTRRIHLYPHSAWEKMTVEEGTLFINQDSFPEMHSSAVNSYLDRICSSGRAYLLSINHECMAEYQQSKDQLNVSAIARKFKSLELLERTPNFIREGYVDLLFRVTNHREF